MKRRENRAGRALLPLLLALSLLFALPLTAAAAGYYGGDYGSCYGNDCGDCYGDDCGDDCGDDYEAYRVSGSDRVPQLLGAQTDAPAAWAKAEVQKAQAFGLIPADLDRNYAQTASRLDFAKLAAALMSFCTEMEVEELLQNAGGSGTVFSDCSDVSVQLVSAFGIVNGVGAGQFAPERGITRQEAATMLGRLADLMECRGQTPQNFSDSYAIAAWAKDAVGKVSALVTSDGRAVMGSTGGNSFSPLLSYSREQAFCSFLRLLYVIDETGNGPTEPTQPTQPTEPTEPTEPTAPADVREAQERVLALCNEERAKHGAPPLRLDDTLCDLGQIRAQEIIELFSHTRPSGEDSSSVLRGSGLRYSLIAENIAYGASTPEGVMEMWMNSQGHRENILNPELTTLGVGVDLNAYTWVQLFLG